MPGAFVIAIFGLLGCVSAAAAAGGDTSIGPAFRIQIVSSENTTEGTCFLIHTEPQHGEVVAYFLTAGRLFKPEALGEDRAQLLRIRVILDESNVIETSGANVVFAGDIDRNLDLALVKATTSITNLMAPPVSMESPRNDDVFVLRGYRGRDTEILTERLRLRSDGRTAGDRAIADGDGFLGAPAMGQAGVFGIVTGFSAGIPVVTPLLSARGFLAGVLPGWTAAAASSPTFTLEQRRIDGPLVPINCDAAKSGDVDVPIPLADDETLVDATASFTNPYALRLGDITVLSLEDRVVKLRFTMLGLRPSPLAAPCPAAQALITVAVNLVVLRHP
jgi:hypothetical protein